MSDCERCGGTVPGRCYGDGYQYAADGGEKIECPGCPDCENARLRDLLRRVVEEWDDTRRGTLYYDIRRELEKGGDAQWDHAQTRNAYSVEDGMSDDAPSVGKGTGAGMDSLTEDPVADHAAKTTGETGQEKAGDKPEASERLRFSTRPGLSDGCQPEGRILSRESLKVHLLLAQSPDQQIAQPNQAIVLDSHEALRAERDEYKRECEAVSDFVSGTSADPFGNVEYIKGSIDHWRERAETAEGEIQQLVDLEVALNDEIERLRAILDEWEAEHAHAKRWFWLNDCASERRRQRPRSAK